MCEVETWGHRPRAQQNVWWLVTFLHVVFSLPRLDQCLELLIKTNRLPEAAFLARTYLPSQVSRVVKLWRENLAKVNQKVSFVADVFTTVS